MSNYHMTAAKRGKTIGRIRQKMITIQQYIEAIKTKQSPNLMDKSGTAFLVSRAEKPLNLTDASELVRAMFK